jgi:hypothetical protein
MNTENEIVIVIVTKKEEANTELAAGIARPRIYIPASVFRTPGLEPLL